MKVYVIVINDVDIDQGESNACAYREAFVDEQSAFEKMKRVCEEDFQRAIDNGCTNACIDVDNATMTRTLFYDEKELGAYSNYCVQTLEV